MRYRALVKKVNGSDFYPSVIDESAKRLLEVIALSYAQNRPLTVSAACITVRLLEAVEILGITNQGVPEHVTAKFQITQVLVDDGGTTVIAIFSGT
jgi:hypothetical protein